MSFIKYKHNNFQLLDVKNQLLSFIQKDQIIAQNILMKIPDRDIALSMLYMDKDEENIIFSLLSNEKIKMIKEELSYQKKLKIHYQLYLDISNNLLKKFYQYKNEDKKRTYIRPQINKRNNKEY